MMNASFALFFFFEKLLMTEVAIAALGEERKGHVV